MANKKPQLVLLHGLFGSPLGLETITQDLKNAGYEVFVPAVPPFAGSETSWSQHTESDPTKKYAEYFRDYFSRNNIKKPVLIGHSMGTLVASSIVKYYPDSVNSKIIFLSPISHSPNAFISKISILSAYLPPKVIDWFTTQFLIVPRNHQFFRETLAKVHRCSYDQRPNKQHIKEATKFSTSSTIVKNLQDIIPSHQEHFQIYLLAGEHDRLVSPATTRKAASVLNNSPEHRFDCECDFLPQTGHLHNYEKPHETAQRIIAFLEK